MASEAQIAANKANSQLSTGPTTPKGRAKSSMNSLKHGLRSKKVEFQREESYAFEDRLRKWGAVADVKNDVEEYLVYLNVSLSFKLDRIERAQIARSESLIENAELAELEEVHELGKRLFFDPAGPTSLYGNPPVSFDRKAKTSWNGQAVDEYDPAVLLWRLESTQQGCLWLVEQWQALLEQLETLGFWQSPDRLKLIRLLGRHPVEAREDWRITALYVASHALKPVGKCEFKDLSSDMSHTQLARYWKALKERWPDLFHFKDPAHWKQILVEMVQQSLKRLYAKLEIFEANAEIDAERTLARLSYDPSAEGEGLRKHQMTCLNRFFRGMETFRKYQAGRRGEGRRAGHSTSDDGRQDRSYVKRRETHNGNGSELCADRLSGLADSPDERLLPVVDSNTGLSSRPTSEVEISSRLSEAEAAQERAALTREWGVISGNSTSEADFTETTSAAETPNPIEDTANSGDILGLDTVSAQPVESTDPRIEKVRGSAIDGRGLKHVRGTPGGRVDERVARASLSNRAKKRQRRKNDREVLEKLAEDASKVGITSLSARLRKILRSRP
jgi:hypothetical protein